MLKLSNALNPAELAAAREWCADVYPDYSPALGTADAVERAIDRDYCGGITQFKRDAVAR